MLDWNALHPYNAIHVVSVSAALDLNRLRLIIGSTLEALQLTNLELAPDRRTYQFCGGPSVCDLKVIEGGDVAASALATEIEWQLNTAFATGERLNPFRFFVAHGTDEFKLGLAYFHPIADAEAIVGLVKELVDAYRAGGVPAPPAPVTLPPDRPLGQLVRHPAAFVRQIAALPSLILTTRSSTRPHDHDPQEQRNGFTFFSWEAGTLGSLQAAARSWGVTLNDLFLALLMQSLLPLAATQRRGRRRKLTVGCIVNTRKELRVASRTFGLFLGSFFVDHEIQDGISLRELATAVNRQTRHIKAARLYLGTPVQLAVTRLARRFFSTKRPWNFYQKHCPLWGGITNMNINSLWAPSASGGVADYFRAVSTGPVTPLVLSVTTAADRVNVGLSYRTAVFSAAAITEVQSRFIKSVAQLKMEA